MNDIATEVINHLNSVTGKKYDLNSPYSVDRIRELVNEGYSQDDFIAVIDKKFKEWRGTEFEKYLRPSTLFGAKFEKYLKNDARISQNRVQQLFDAVQRSKQSAWKLDKK